MKKMMLYAIVLTSFFNLNFAKAHLGNDFGYVIRTFDVETIIKPFRESGGSEEGVKIMREEFAKNINLAKNRQDDLKLENYAKELVMVVASPSVNIKRLTELKNLMSNLVIHNMKQFDNLFIGVAGRLSMLDRVALIGVADKANKANNARIKATKK